MCIKCNFLLKPYPSHKPDDCPLLLQCAYCSTCGIYNAHFPSSCPKRQRGALSLKAHLSEGWQNANKIATPSATKIFRMVDDEDTYKEYCKTHNIVLAQTLEGYRLKVRTHLLSRGYVLETYKDGLSKYSLPVSEEEAEKGNDVEEKPVVLGVVPMKLKLKKLSK